MSELELGVFFLCLGCLLFSCGSQLVRVVCRSPRQSALRLGFLHHGRSDQGAQRVYRGKSMSCPVSVFRPIFVNFLNVYLFACFACFFFRLARCLRESTMRAASEFPTIILEVFFFASFCIFLFGFMCFSSALFQVYVCVRKSSEKRINATRYSSHDSVVADTNQIA